MQRTFLCIILALFLFWVNCQGPHRNLGLPSSSSTVYFGGSDTNRGLHSQDDNAKNDEFQSIRDFFKGASSRDLRVPSKSTPPTQDNRGLDGEPRNMGMPLKTATTYSSTTNGRGLDGDTQNIGSRFQNLLNYFREKNNESQRDLGLPLTSSYSSSYSNTVPRGLDHERDLGFPLTSSTSYSPFTNRGLDHNEAHHPSNEISHLHNKSNNQSNSSKHDKPRNLEESNPSPEQPSELIVDVSNVAKGFSNETQEPFDNSSESNSSFPTPPPFRGNETRDFDPFDFSNFSNSSFPRPPPFRGNETREFDFFTDRGPNPPFWTRGGNSSHSFLDKANFSDILQKSPFWQGGNGLHGMFSFSNSSEEIARGHPLPRSGGQRFNPWESLPKYGSRIPSGGSQNTDFMNVGNRFNPFDREGTKEATGDNSGPQPLLPGDKRP